MMLMAAAPEVIDGARRIRRFDGRGAAAAVVAGAAYFGAHLVGWAFPDLAGVVATVWPASGIGLAALLLSRRRLWPAMLVVLFIAGNAANLWLHRSLVVSLGSVLANILESLGCALFVTELCGGHARFTTIRDVVVLLGAATVVNAATAFLGAAVAHVAHGAPFWQCFATWWIANGIGILVVTPFVVTWAELHISRQKVTISHGIESAAFFVAWCALAFLLFHLRWDRHPMHLGIYLLLPVLVWPALRLGQRQVTLGIVFLVAVEITSAAMWHGPSLFGEDDVVERLVAVNAFSAVAAVTGMLLAASQHERARFLRSLAESEAKFATAFHDAPVVMTLSQFDTGTLVDVNEEFVKVSGRTREEAIGKTTTAIGWSSPQDRQKLVEAVLAHGHVQHMELAGVTRAGELKTMLASAARVMAEGRAYLLIVGVDISGRRAAEAELRQNSYLLARSQSMSHVGHWFLDPDAGVLSASDELLRIMRLRKEEVRLEVFISLIHPEDVEHAMACIRGATDRGEGFELEHRLLLRDGTLKWVRTVGEPQSRGDGRYRIVGTTQDVTARQLAEEALRASEQRYRLLVEQSTDGIWVIDRDGVIIDVNGRYCGMVGLARAEIVGRRASEFVLQADDKGTAAHLKSVASSWTERYETSHRTKDGGQIDLEVNVTYDVSSGVFFFLFRDLTQRKRMEAQERQSQKMEAIGSLAGGIAHDFNNLLFIMLGNAQLLAADKSLPGNHHQHVEAILAAGKRARDLVARILAFSRKSEVCHVLLDLTELTRESIRMLRDTIPKAIEMRLDIGPVTRAVRGDPTELHQVLMNLCSNAVQAMEPDPGVLTMEIRQVESPPGEESGGTVLSLAVSDTGPGISPGILNRVFEPYFTTKEKGRGTGLGLAVVHGIVTRMKGRITVESAMGKGARFVVLLPTAGPLPSAAPQAASTVSSIGGRILIVDDEPAVLRVFNIFLERLGCEATCVDSARDALAIVTSRPEDFRVVITDQDMPQIKGMRLAAMIRDAGIDLPVILCSGYGDTIDASMLASVGVRLILPKPVSFEELAEGLRKVLGDVSAGPW